MPPLADRSSARPLSPATDPFTGRQASIGQDQTMPFLSYETRKFSTSLGGPASGLLSLPPAALIWGAVTVGATPISMGGTPRPLIELCWRAALAAASLEEDPRSDRW